MKGICALYDNETDLKESHIFPKFVINLTKKTGSKYLRRIVEPNKRVQDGLKLYLLSFEAEQEFGLREKWFAENILVPYLDGKSKLNYDENLYYFVISFLWRVLVTEIKKDDNIKNQWYFEELKKVEVEWKNFLINEKTPSKYHNMNLFFTKRENHTTDLKNVDFYYTRILDCTIVSNPNQSLLIIYGKFNRFIFWSVIKSPDYIDDLYEVEIHPKKGIFELPQSLNYEPIISFITNRIRGIEKHSLPNESQQDIILKEINKNPEKFCNSDLGQSICYDNIDLEK